ncbi:MAG: hypothetical protein ABW275_05420 [Hansschlegelia sp.]
MNVLPKAKSTRAWRFCVRAAVAFCFVVFGISDAVQQGFAGHGYFEPALSYAVSDASTSGAADQSGVHVSGKSGSDSDMNGQALGHGCDGCSAISDPMLQVAASPISSGSPLAWASVPSTAGREPLIDLPPPRA